MPDGRQATSPTATMTMRSARLHASGCVVIVHSRECDGKGGEARKRSPPTRLHRDERFLGHVALAVGGGWLGRQAIGSRLGDGLRLLGVLLLAAPGQHFELIDDDLGLPVSD